MGFPFSSISLTQGLLCFLRKLATSILDPDTVLLALRSIATTSRGLGVLISHVYKAVALANVIRPPMSTRSLCVISSLKRCYPDTPNQKYMHKAISSSLVRFYDAEVEMSFA